MKKPMKAVLLSALVFPGAGHFLLKKPIRGLVLLGIGLGSLYMLVSGPVTRALSITEKIKTGEIPPDMNIIIGLVSQPFSGTEVQIMNYGLWILIITWIFGIADSYLQGRKQVE